MKYVSLFGLMHLNSTREPSYYFTSQYHPLYIVWKIYDLIYASLLHVHLDSTRSTLLLSD